MASAVYFIFALNLLMISIYEIAFFGQDLFKLEEGQLLALVGTVGAKVAFCVALFVLMVRRYHGAARTGPMVMPDAIRALVLATGVAWTLLGVILVLNVLRAFYVDESLGLFSRSRDLLLLALWRPLAIMALGVLVRGRCAWLGRLYARGPIPLFDRFDRIAAVIANVKAPASVYQGPTATGGTDAGQPEADRPEQK